MSTHRALVQARQDVLDTVAVLVFDTRRTSTGVNFWEAIRALDESYLAYRALADELGGDSPAVAKDTSIRAAKSLPDRGTKRAKVLRAIMARHQLTEMLDGLTTDEIEVQLAWPHTTVSSAVNALETRGLIRDSGKRRPTRAGRARGERGLPVTTAAVYEPTDHAYRLHDIAGGHG